MKATKIQAIKHARQNVEFRKEGSCYKILKYDNNVNMWREGFTSNYWHTKCFYSQALLDTAAEFLNKPTVNYNGGSWIKYMKKL
jgi:hypothetical protein